MTPLERSGFGSRLLEKVVGFELAGDADLDYRAEGLLYRLTFPLK